jgi:hypothetical protein
MLLPALIFKKFGKPVNIYVPSLSLGGVTKHTRMLQTITPFAVKYGLTINSAYDVEDYKQIGKALLKENGTVVIVWEHKNIVPILQYLGIKEDLQWPGNDYDSIWIVSFPNGRSTYPGQGKIKPAIGMSFLN